MALNLELKIALARTIQHLYELIARGLNKIQVHNLGLG